MDEWTDLVAGVTITDLVVVVVTVVVVGMEIMEEGEGRHIWDLLVT